MAVSNKEIAGYTVGFIVASGLIAWGTYRLINSQPLVPFSLPAPSGVAGMSYDALEQLTRRLVESSPMTPTGYRAIILERWLNSPGEVSFRAPPASARPVRLVTPMNTGPLRTVAGSSTRAYRLRFFAWIQRTLAALNRTELDVRVLGKTLAVETAWLSKVWNYNFANGKAQGRLWAPSRDAAYRGEGLVTTIPGAQTIHILRDRVRLPSGWIGSVDGYPGFESETEGFRHYLTTVGNRALQGARTGGLEGLREAEGALAEGGFSGASRSARLLASDAYWAGNQRAIGSVWDDRAAFDALLTTIVP